MTSAPPERFRLAVGERSLTAWRTTLSPLAPLVVMESGLGATADFWGWLQPALSAAASTLSYDRAGVGRSDTPPRLGAEEGLDRAESDLAAVIASGPQGAPVFLLGHSSGALLVQAFARSRPGVVTGLVLLDPTPADPSALPVWITGAFGPTAAATRGLAWLVAHGAFRRSNPFAGPLQTLPPDAAAGAAAAMVSPSHLRAMAGELDELPTLRARACAAASGGGPPALVVSAGDWRRRGALGRRVLAAHAALADAAPSNRRVTIEGADHLSLVSVERFARRTAEEIAQFIKEVVSA